MPDRKLHKINGDGIEEKHCQRCDQWLPLGSFNKSTKRWDGLQPYCRHCHWQSVMEWQKKNPDKYQRSHRRYHRQRNRDIAGYVYNVLQCGARKRRIMHCTRSDFITWWINTPDLCEYCGLAMDEIKQSWPAIKGTAYRLSVDRKDHTKGYIVGNMVKACYVCNLMRHRFLSYEEAKQFLGPMVRSVVRHRASNDHNHLVIIDQLANEKTQR